MDASNNPYSSQNNNFPVPSGGQNPNRAPGQGHWAAYQLYTATPAGSTHGFGVNDYDNVIYTSNTLRSDDPAFYGLADACRPPYNNEFGSHSSYYASSRVLNLSYFQVRHSRNTETARGAVSVFLLPRTLLRPILELDQIPGNPGPLFRSQKQTQKQRRNRIE